MKSMTIHGLDDPLETLIRETADLFAMIKDVLKRAGSAQCRAH